MLSPAPPAGAGVFFIRNNLFASMEIASPLKPRTRLATTSIYKCTVESRISDFIHHSHNPKGNMETITKPAPSLHLSNIKDTLEESVTELNQVLELHPEDTTARQTLYETMQKILRKDAFLAYEGETDVIYKVSTLEEFQFIHPKDRATFEFFPPQNNPPARPAIHWLGWAVVGLIPAGLGTLILSPLAVIAAIQLLRQPVALIDRRRAWIVMIGAFILWLIALVLFFILFLHLV